MDDLDTQISNDLTVRNASALQFMQWVMKRINTATSNSPSLTELTMLANRHPGSHMDDSYKLELIAKMKRAGIF